MAKKANEAERKAYQFFVRKEEADEAFTLQELADETGWKIGTVRTYPSKKWSGFVTQDGKKFRVNGLRKYAENEDIFARLMSQKDSVSNDPRRPPLSPEVEQLVTKAREAAINGLDGYNRAGTLFRTESLTVMMVIAWRLLFHAIFEKQGVPYVYTKDDGSPEIIDGEGKAWDLSACLRKYYGRSNNAVRKNLEFIIGLRNKIEHRFVPEFDPVVAGECQALVLNFDEFLVEQFGEYYAVRETLAVPLQTSSRRSPAQINALKTFQGKQFDELREYVDGFRDELPDEIYQDPKYSFRVYLIPRLGNHRTSSDLAVEFVNYDPDRPEELQRLVALIRDKFVPVANAGTFKPTQVAREVAARTERVFRVREHTLAWKLYKVRQPGMDPTGCKPEYCLFDQVHNDHVYTQAWVEFLVNKMSSEAEYQRLLAYKEE